VSNSHLAHQAFLGVKRFFLSLKSGFSQLKASRLGRLVFLLNLLALFVLISGASILNEFSQGLIDTKKESLTAQADLMGDVIAEVATQGYPEPSLEPIATILFTRFVQKGQRAQLYDANGQLLGDSYVVSEDIDTRPLPPALKRSQSDLSDLSDLAQNPDASKKPDTQNIKARQGLLNEVKSALTGGKVAAVRRNERGERVVSVAIPIRHVKVVLAVLVLESGGVDEIIAAQRKALIPFILVALGVYIMSAAAMVLFISRPVQRLSWAADNVRLQKTRAIALPDIEARKDELGALARSLRSMTASQMRRMDEIESFAADVAHEIKNPLTSIRSALETLSLLRDENKKARLMAVINDDVRRIDRLITDISNASRLDAELSRDLPHKVGIGSLLKDISQLYADNKANIAVAFTLVDELSLTPDDLSLTYVNGREGPLGQVFSNVIDNALSFSPPGGQIAISLERHEGDSGPELMILVDDDGPGIPEDNLETIFERFYTSRPKGVSFGRNSGLGLSISRQIIEAHQGRIFACNRKDTQQKIIGARFCIILPCVYHANL
jgi:two-component system, OmpR family, sensor histidine kinase ChvG